MSKKRSLILAGSIAAHGALALGAGAISKTKVVESFVVTLTETFSTPAEEPPEPPATTEPEPAPAAAPRSARPTAPMSPGRRLVAAGNGVTEGSGHDVPDFGLSFAAGDGPGVAVAVPARAAPRPTEPVAPVRRVLTAPARTGCVEPLVKATPLHVPKPSFPEAARGAGVSGRVRIELSIDEHGRVTAVRLLEGLGHGVDELALAASRSARFEPASRCGRPLASTFVVAMRFVS